MSDNPYHSPVAVDESTDDHSRLAKAAMSLLVVLVLWVLLAPCGMLYFMSAIKAPDTESDICYSYTTNILYMSTSVLYSLLLVTGAWSMVRRGSYVWAVSTSWLAMVPMMGPFYFLGIPLGIWTLSVLRYPSVRASFRSA